MAIPIIPDHLLEYFKLKGEIREKELQRCKTIAEEITLKQVWAIEDSGEKIANAMKYQRRGGLFF